jgi:hypothetical protein
MNPTMTRPAFGPQSGSSAEAQKHSEGATARGIEQYTAQMPSDWFLWAAGGSILASLTLQCLGRKEDAQFVGQWVAPFMLLGVYNKIVKVAGSDRVHES